MHNKWKQQLTELSGNLTTNEVMPEHIVQTLLEEDFSLKDKISFEEMEFPKFKDEKLNAAVGLNIVAGLQNLSKREYLTLFRAIRFPTYKRMCTVLTDTGFTISNFEQERILSLYTNPRYLDKRNEIQKDSRFWVVPQERVVQGVPLFCLMNDALQIHRAFRGDEDIVMIAVVHIPKELIVSKSIKFVANTAIDLDYKNTDRDIVVTDYKDEDGRCVPDYEILRAKGVDLHEMYTTDLPLELEKINELGIKQEFYFLDIYKITDLDAINCMFNDADLLKRNKHFLHGFFGDQNIFGRRKAAYLPYSCSRVTLKHKNES